MNTNFPWLRKNLTYTFISRNFLLVNKCGPQLAQCCGPRFPFQGKRLGSGALAT